MPRPVKGPKGSPAQPGDLGEELIITADLPGGQAMDGFVEQGRGDVFRIVVKQPIPIKRDHVS